MTFVTEVDAVDLLSFSVKIVEGLLLPIATEGAKDSVNSPLIATIGAEEIPFPYLFL
jgi:hypothetical protein